MILSNQFTNTCPSLPSTLILESGIANQSYSVTDIIALRNDTGIANRKCSKITEKNH